MPSQRETNVELDDARALWSAYGTKLEAQSRAIAHLARTSAAGAAETAIGRLTRGVRVEVALNVLAVVLLGSFLGIHIAEPATALATIALDIFAIAMLVASVAQAVLLARIRYDGPLFNVTQAFDRVRAIRARATFWTLVTAPLAWAPLAVVAIRAIGGPDALSASGIWSWVAANAAFGIAVLVAAVVLARRYLAGGGGDARLVRVANVLTGASFRAAREKLAALRRYEADEVDGASATVPDAPAS
jgi:hypothetical protein